MTQAVQSLPRVSTNIRNKTPGKTDGIILLQSDVHPDGPTAHCAVGGTQTFCIHSDSSSCSFIFGPLKEAFEGHTFTWDDSMQEATVEVAGQGIPCRLDMPACASVGILSKRVW
jgi:hypothetical protein